MGEDRGNGLLVWVKNDGSASLKDAYRLYEARTWIRTTTTTTTLATSI